jgi:hypothetical protein
MMFLVHMLPVFIALFLFAVVLLPSPATASIYEKYWAPFVGWLFPSTTTTAAAVVPRVYLKNAFFIILGIKFFWLFF